MANGKVNPEVGKFDCICEDKFFLTNSDSECANCSVNCPTCSGTANTCLTCMENGKLNEDTKTCECIDTYFFNPSNLGVCLKCNDTCNTCRNYPHYCTSCY